MTWHGPLLPDPLRTALREQRHNEIMVRPGWPGKDGYTERVLADWGVDGHNPHTNVCSAAAGPVPVQDGHRPAQPRPRPRPAQEAAARND